MALKTLLEKLLPDLAATLMRFPVAAAVAVTLGVYVNATGKRFWEEGGETIWLAGWTAFLASGALHLFAEARGFSRGANTGLAAAGAALVGGGVYLLRQGGESWIFLGGGLALAVMVAGYLAPGRRQGALWWFNARLILGFILACLVTLVFGGGISAILGSLQYLFDVEIDYKAYEHVWMTAMTIVGPVYGLSLVPRDMEAERPQSNNLLDRGAAVLVNYLSVPIAIIYALILHAYAVKIAMGGALPKNQIGWMVAFFALGGTATWLIAWPWRDSGTRLVRVFIRSWFWLTLVPAVLLVLALKERIDGYGVTPDRYALGVIAAWFALIGAYLAWRRALGDMRFIVGSLAVMLILSAMGPWGARGLSLSSQFGRLETILAASGALKDGKIVQPMPALPQERKSDAQSIVYFLSGLNALDLLRPWFADVKDNPFAENLDRWQLSNKIITALGVEGYAPAPDTVSFASAKTATVTFAAGVRLAGPVRVLFSCEEAAKAEDSACSIRGALRIKMAAKTWEISALPLLQAAKAAAGQKPFLFKTPEGDLVVISLYGSLADPANVSGGEFWIAAPAGP